MKENTTVVVPFKFDAREVRTLLMGGQPWFFAVDVCHALGLTDTNKALIGLDDDEKCEHEQYSGSGRKPVLINESGLYSLILRSRKAEAKRFKKWVTAEVLPAIRKHGRYEDEQGRMPTLVNELIGMSELNVIKGTIRDKAKDVLPAKRRSFNAAMCSRLHTRFNVPRLEMIPADQFEAACNFVASYSIEGEWIAAGNTVAVISFDADDAQAIHLVLCHAKHLSTMKEQMYKAGQALGSDLLVEAFSHMWEMQPHLSHLAKSKAGELASIHDARVSGARRIAA